MRTRGLLLILSASLALAGCGESSSSEPTGAPWALPVGATEWDVTAPAWFHAGTLHVGDESVELGERVDTFVLGRTGAYWMRGDTLMFTSAEGATEEVAEVGWDNLAVSADRSVLATVDQSRGPTDRYGTHVMQVAVFDTRTGEQLYRTPDEEPDDGDDLADLYGEIMPLLEGVSTEHVFYDDATIDLAVGSVTPTTEDAEGLPVYEDWAETLFPDGYRVGLRGNGRERQVADSRIDRLGILSPDRSTIFDTSVWPTPAVVYDAATGRQREIGAPWRHFTLVGWTDEDTFFGVAERIVAEHPVNNLRARQVVSCELDSLECTPVSPVVETDDSEDVEGENATLLVEGGRPYGGV
ncbi:hypothetical protein L615_002700000580 [Nocardioides sp. J9]|uniref:hypothetical protein n=1 Tax=Nocardioides sp. J9 TaxID=935844 RepID=UPI0011A7B752|nr:hypothetical protein [Nocardioides sp. J9]TWG99277.1 hypothetical protein L615_002700000580 [Nocardioides sp. J9]